MRNGPPTAHTFLYLKFCILMYFDFKDTFAWFYSSGKLDTKGMSIAESGPKPFDGMNISAQNDAIQTMSQKISSHQAAGKTHTICYLPVAQNYRIRHDSKPTHYRKRLFDASPRSNDKTPTTETSLKRKRTHSNYHSEKECAKACPVKTESLKSMDNESRSQLSRLSGSNSHWRATNCDNDNRSPNTAASKPHVNMNSKKCEIRKVTTQKCIPERSTEKRTSVHRPHSIQIKPSTHQAALRNRGSNPAEHRVSIQVLISSLH